VKFGFIAHPTTMALQRHVKMVDLTDRLSEGRRTAAIETSGGTATKVPFADFASVIAAGATCNGVLFISPIPPRR